MSLNIYLLLITLEINSSWGAATGARCYWQTAVAVTDNTRYLGILHCNHAIRLSLPLPSVFFSLPNAPLSLVLPLQAQLYFLFQSGAGEKWQHNQNICHGNNPLKLKYTEKGIAGEEWPSRKDEGPGYLWNERAWEETKVLHMVTRPGNTMARKREGECSAPKWVE